MHVQHEKTYYSSGTATGGGGDAMLPIFNEKGGGRSIQAFIHVDGSSTAERNYARPHSRKIFGWGQNSEEYNG